MKHFNKIGIEGNLVTIMAQIDTDKQTCAIPQIENPYSDWAYFLEAAAYATYLAAKYKEKPLDEAIAYAQKWIADAATTYKSKL